MKFTLFNNRVFFTYMHKIKSEIKEGKAKKQGMLYKRSKMIHAILCFFYIDKFFKILLFPFLFYNFLKITKLHLPLLIQNYY